MRAIDVALDTLFDSTVGVVDATVPGGRVSVVYDIVKSETVRRSKVNLGTIERRDLLEALAALPLGAPVPWNDIEPQTQVELDTAPTGCVVSSGETVERVVEPAIEPRCYVAAFEGQRSVEDISLFAAMAPRLLVGSRRPSEATAAQVRELGVGFAVAARGEIEVVIDPNLRLVRPGPRRWFVQERIWRLHQESAEIHAFR